MTTRPVKDPSAPKWFAPGADEVLRSVGSALDGLSVTCTYRHCSNHRITAPFHRRALQNQKAKGRHSD